MFYFKFLHVLLNRRVSFNSISFRRKLTRLVVLIAIVLFFHHLTQVQFLKRQNGGTAGNTNKKTSLNLINMRHTTLDTKLNHNDLNKSTEKEKEQENRMGMPFGANFRKLSINLVSMEEVDNSQVALQQGWWLPRPEFWILQHNCHNSAACNTTIKVNATPGIMFTICQFISLRQLAPIKGVHFSVKTSNNAQLWAEQATNYYGAAAMIRFSDGSNQVLHLNFRPVKQKFTRSYVSYIFPNDGIVVQSITLMLGVNGLFGEVNFKDVELNPIVQTRQNNDEDLSKNHFVATCPDELSPLINTFKFKTKHFILNNNGFEIMKPVTMVTQLSFDRWKIWTTRILPEWKGPLSVALYVPIGEENLNTKLGDLAKTLENFTRYCDVTVVYGAHQHEKYPINYLRNVAMQKVRTEYMLLVDADFCTSPNFIESFLSAIRKENSLTDVYVVPAFEYPFGVTVVPLAKSKSELVATIQHPSVIVQPFRHLASEISHQATDYQRWYTSTDLYTIKDYQTAYEPYLVMKTSVRELVRYDERFSGYGMNKISFIMELVVAGFNFKVLPYNWVTHLPHMSSSQSFTFVTDFSENLNNRAIRFEFISDLTKRYKLGGCKAL